MAGNDERQEPAPADSAYRVGAPLVGALAVTALQQSPLPPSAIPAPHRHSRESGNPGHFQQIPASLAKNPRIPAFAGMTDPTGMAAGAGMTTDGNDDRRE